jgi:hypothetical protein
MFEGMTAGRVNAMAAALRGALALALWGNLVIFVSFQPGPEAGGFADLRPCRPAWRLDGLIS